MWLYKFKITNIFYLFLFNLQAIGSRNLLKSIAKQRESQQQQLRALIAEKKTQLERYAIFSFFLFLSFFIFSFFFCPEIQLIYYKKKISLALKKSYACETVE